MKQLAKDDPSMSVTLDPDRNGVHVTGSPSTLQNARKRIAEVGVPSVENRERARVKLKALAEELKRFEPLGMESAVKPGHPTAEALSDTIARIKHRIEIVTTAAAEPATQPVNQAGGTVPSDNAARKQ